MIRLPFGPTLAPATLAMVRLMAALASVRHARPATAFPGPAMTPGMILESRRQRRRRGGGEWGEEADDRFDWQPGPWSSEPPRRRRPHWTEEAGIHSWLAPHKRILPWIVAGGAFLVGSSLFTPFFGWIPALWALRWARRRLADMPEAATTVAPPVQATPVEAPAPPPKPAPAPVKPEDLPFATELTQEATRKLDRLDSLVARVRQPEIERRTRRIIELARAIVANVEQDPADAPRARRVLTFYLDSVIKIVDHALVISSQGPNHESLTRIPDALADVEEVMRHHGDKMLENDILNLDTELSLLERTLKAERPLGRPLSRDG